MSLTWLDIVVLLLMAVAFVAGLFRGLIGATLGIVGILFALIGTFYLAPWVVQGLGVVHDPWMMLLVVLALFIILWLSLKLVVGAIEKMFEKAGLGSINRLAGGLFYLALITAALSLLVFVLDRSGLLPDEIRQCSLVRPFLVQVAQLLLHVLNEVLRHWT